MSDLISRQAAIKALCEKGMCGDKQCNAYPCEDVRAIEQVPAIDPVKHGKWELVGSTTMGDPFGKKAWGKMFRCSECGFVRHVISEHYKFCPNCGSKNEVAE